MLPRVDVVLPDGPNNATRGSAKRAERMKWEAHVQNAADNLQKELAEPFPAMLESIERSAERDWLENQKQEWETLAEEENEEAVVTLHKPTAQEMLQHELMRLTLDPSYKPVHPNALQQREIVLLLAKRDYTTLKYAPKKFRYDKEISLAAVENNALYMRFVPKALQNDKEFVLAAVKSNGLALQYASKALQKDREIWEPALKQNAYVAGLFPKDWWQIPHLVKYILGLNWRAVQYLSQDLKDNYLVMMQAMRHNGWAMSYASERLQDDDNFVRGAVSYHPEALSYASPRLQNDPELRELAEEIRKKAFA